jgi:C-terminal processing protease CtpA/Prc
MKTRVVIAIALACAAAMAAGPRPAPAAGPTAPPREMKKFDHDQGQMMLSIVMKDLEDYYYDPTFHGLKMPSLVEQAKQAIDNAHTQAEIYAAIANTLLPLDDSHTWFVPPSWSAKVTFGWFVQMVGDRCHVMAVQPGSDAESQGLKKGDLVVSIDSQPPTRDNLHVMMYDQRMLAPRAKNRLEVQPPGGAAREVVVHPRIEPQKIMLTKWDHATQWRELEDEAYLDRHRFKTINDDVLVWKMPQFNIPREDVSRMITKVSKYKNLIIDLRGNPGGAVECLQFMVGGFVGENVTIGTERGRDTSHPQLSRKTKDRYEGNLILLIDSGSASAAELFSRTMQLNGRAKVLGDRSAGAVMVSMYYERKVGMGTTRFIGTSITVADIIMTDGKSLEHTGVVPDEVILPTAEDLAFDRDPVLSRALWMCGVTMGPIDAGKMFPFEWKR